MPIKSLENEEWKPLPGFETSYMVSSHGRIKSCMRYVKMGKGLRRNPEKLISQTVHPVTGHCRVQVSKNGKIKTIVIYRAVAQVFTDLPPDIVVHLDGNRQNNHFSNLTTGISNAKGQDHHKAVLNDTDVEEIRKMRMANIPVEQIATKLGISVAQVSKITSRKSRQDI